jgi:hypothetical protein
MMTKPATKAAPVTSEASTESANQNHSELDPQTICTLSAAELDERLAWLRAEILPYAVTSESHANTVAWEFDDAPGLGAKLDQLVALERECCSGIEFVHTPSATPARHRLEVRGVDPQALVFAALAPESEPPLPSTGPTALKTNVGHLPRRLAKAVGFGALMSALVCCVLPAALAGLFGATVAAPFVALDDPAVIAAGLVVFGGVLFALETRRRASRLAASEGAGSCGPGC